MTMTPHTRELVKSFLEELDKVRLTDQPPMHVVSRRLALASVIREDVPGDDLEELAVRAEADALTDLCWVPRTPTWCAGM
jgi:hypothetical protein